MDDELKNFIKVWIMVFVSLCYCYHVVALIQKGMMRLLSLLPVFYVFTILPLNLYSFHFSGPTALFLVWFGNFKLLLFAFDQGPLSPPRPKLSHFICIACLPIKVKRHPPLNTKNPSHLNAKFPQQSSPNAETPPKPTTNAATKTPRSTATSLVIRALLLAMIIRAYDYRTNMHSFVVSILYCCHLYLGLEILLALAATPARAIFGLELEPQFNEPYLATSLQDFWGRRWNRVSTSILRATIYNPISSIFTRVVGPSWAPLPAVVAAFVVSGLMHEIIFYYLTRAAPTWEVTWFFVLHGMCVVIEVLVKNAVTHRWHLHREVSRLLTMVFVVATCVWLLFPQLLRNGVVEKAIWECSMFI